MNVGSGGLCNRPKCVAMYATWQSRHNERAASVLTAHRIARDASTGRSPAAARTPAARRERILRMVRFAADANAADAAALRATRDKHDIFFEDGDQAPALRAVAPYLSWVAEADGTWRIPFAEFCDFTLRFARIRGDSVAIDRRFTQWQVTAVPLHRLWHLMLPRLGLPTGVAAPAVWTRRQLRRAAHNALDRWR